LAHTCGLIFQAGRAIVGVEHQVVKELLDFQGRRVNRVVVQVEEQAFLFFWVWGRGLRTMLLLKIVGDSKVEDQSQERFLIASHEETIEEKANLSIDSTCFRIQAVEPIDHPKNKAPQDARRMGAVWRQVHVQVERFLVESIGHSAIFMVS
jgi:hypothetical protein